MINLDFTIDNLILVMIFYPEDILIQINGNIKFNYIFMLNV